MNFLSSRRPAVWIQARTIVFDDGAGCGVEETSVIIGPQIVVSFDDAASGNVRNRPRINHAEGIVAARASAAAEINRTAQLDARHGKYPAAGGARQLAVKHGILKGREGIAPRFQHQGKSVRGHAYSVVVFE